MTFANYGLINDIKGKHIKHGNTLIMVNIHNKRRKLYVIRKVNGNVE